MNSDPVLVAQLKTLGLGADEASLYLALLQGPGTHLGLSRLTGINRSRVYRLVEQLEKRSLVTRRSDDQGVFLVAADPSTLEVELVTQEQKLKHQRRVLNQLVPSLDALQFSEESSFVVRTYEGVEGFKQMLWHELKAKGEALVFGDGPIEALVPSRRWAEQHRQRSVEASYRIRELMNPGAKKEVFTANEAFLQHHYQARHLPPATLLLEQQIVIYNDTVATYHWRHGQKAGVEIINASFAHMMRQTFERFWHMAGRVERGMV